MSNENLMNVYLNFIYTGRYLLFWTTFFWFSISLSPLSQSLFPPFLLSLSSLTPCSSLSLSSSFFLSLSLPLHLSRSFAGSWYFSINKYAYVTEYTPTTSTQSKHSHTRALSPHPHSPSHDRTESCSHIQLYAYDWSVCRAHVISGRPVSSSVLAPTCCVGSPM